jgi:hypothetical protein
LLSVCYFCGLAGFPSSRYITGTQLFSNRRAVPNYL